MVDNIHMKTVELKYISNTIILFLWLSVKSQQQQQQRPFNGL